ncbi:MAG: hypothetical protein HY963_02290 [Ignavibacteriales bacterium]|nr:hypothetical protein [Ignavibacteriales bacterium]
MQKLGKEAAPILTDIDEIYNKGIEEARAKKWLIGKGERPALDYKVKIESTDNPTKYLIASFLRKEYKKLLDINGIQYLHTIAYFAQESEINLLFEKEDTGRTERNGKNIFDYKFINENLEKISKWGLIHSGSILCTFSSFTKELLQEINNNIHSFFAYENFGTRQSKGFGCFSITNQSSPKKFEDLLKENFTYVYRYKYPIANLQDKLKQIAQDYKLLKSGRGQRESGGYAKSQLFLYFVTRSRPIRWEKRKIKTNLSASPFKNKLRDGTYQDIELQVDSLNSAIYDEHGNQSWKDSNKYDYAYIRAVLGLAEQFEFQTKGGKFRYVVQVDSKNDLQRFRSPIQFKVNDDSIYLAANDIDKEILNKNFDFKLRLKRDKDIIDKPYFKRDFNIDTPDNFGMGKFLAFALVTGNEKINNYTKV